MDTILVRRLMFGAAVPLLLASCGSLNALEGCESTYVRPDFSALRADLTSARARWQAASLQDYTYDLDQFAAPLGFPTARVTVRGGKVTSALKVGSQPGEVASNAGKTIDERFADLDTIITARQGSKCAELKVTYDASDGHPLTSFSGSALTGLQDGFGSLTISNFSKP